MNKFDLIQDDKQVSNLLEELNLTVYTRKPRAFTRGFARLMTSIFTPIRRSNQNTADKGGTKAAKESPKSGNSSYK